MRVRQYILVVCAFVAFFVSSCEIGINFSAHLYFYPRDFNFGSVNPGDEKSFTLEISNPGVAKLRMAKIGLTPDINTNVQEIYISEAFDENGKPLAIPLYDVEVSPGNAMTVTFMFKPLDTLPKSTNLKIIHNASNYETPFEQQIFGNSSSLTITPTTLDFGKVSQEHEITKNINIVNTSSETIKVFSMNLSGSSDYKIESNSGFMTFEPSQSQNVSISFTPSITGLINASLNINHDSSGSPTVVEITGLGVPEENRAPNIKNAEVSPSIIKGDGTEKVLFTAEVSDDNGIADIKKIQIDLAGLQDASNQVMYDDGTNGDLIANDGIFSLEYLPVSGLNPKAYKITIYATDYSNEQGVAACYLRVYSGNKIYVNDSIGSDVLGTGSALSPYKTIQKGINESNTGNWVVVQNGTYTGSGNVDLDFSRGLPVNKTREIILQSENGTQNTIIDCQGSTTARHRGFLFESNETSSSIVDGFTIINGYAITNGGGILCNNSSPTIQNCVISNCISEQNGGGIYCGTDSKSLIYNNIINNNVAKSGAGIYSNHAGVTIANNTISGNQSSLIGAGICVLYASVIIENNDVSDNTLVSSANTIMGAGIYIKGNAISPTISGNNIEANYMRSSSGDCLGSGLYSELNGSTYNIDNNSFDANILYSNTGSACGGAVYFAGRTNNAKFFDNIVLRNEAYSSDGEAFAGGVFVDEETKPEIKFNNISDNLCKSQTAYVYGGGVYISETSAGLFSDNEVNGNSAISVSSYCYGGGVYIGKVASHLDLKNCEIKSNFGSAPQGQRIYGGGVFVDEEAVVLIKNCDISENSAHMASYGYGIGVCINDNANVTISESKINKNQLESSYYCYGGGVYCSTNTSVTFTECEIINNVSLSRYDGYGGGIYFRQGNFSIIDCKINNNVLNSTRYAYGAGFYCYNHISISITTCEIVGNKCSGSSCRGGAVFTYYSNVNILVSNSLVASNQLDSTDEACGGAIYAYYSIFNIQNCTVACNEAISDTGNAKGGAIYIYNTYITTSLNNSIFWGNFAISRFGSGSPRGNEFYLEQDRVYTVIINNCLYSKNQKNGVESVYDPYNLLNPNLACVFDADPYFVDSNVGNFRLQHTSLGHLNDSPCIDRGNNSLIQSSITKDLDGNPRFVDGNHNSGTEIDFGCFEKQN